MENQKRKWHNTGYGNQKKSKQFSMECGMTGFLCTCNFREKDCIREAYRILEEYDDEIKQSENTEKNKIENLQESEKTNDNDDKDDDDDDGNEDITDALNKEIKELNAQANKSPKTKRFQYIDTGAKNIIFISSTVPNTLELGLKIIKDLDETKKQRSRFILRLIPVQVICRANMNEIKLKASALCEKYFSQEPKTFSIVFNRHCNNTIQRNDIIETLAAVISEKNPGNKAHLKNPDIALVVEIIKGFCLLSIAPEYYKYKKYNLLELCNVTTEKKSQDEAEIKIPDELTQEPEDTSSKAQ
ncbi:hypothetical protein PV326_008783 [Microctonus aethiopoides]|nr:hypothetical protein PV326_008783 [Microctonus aethiopoides]